MGRAKAMFKSDQRMVFGKGTPKMISGRIWARYFLVLVPLSEIEAHT